MQGKFILKNRMRQPLPLEYAGKSISLASGGTFACTEAEYLCAEIQRNIGEKRLKLIAVPVVVEKEVVVIKTEEKVQEIIAPDPVVYEMVPESAGPVPDIALEEEKDEDSLTSICSEHDNGTVGPAKKKRRRSRSGKRNDKDLE